MSINVRNKHKNPARPSDLQAYWTSLNLNKLIGGGERGVRTLDTLPYTHFPGVRLRPLGIQPIEIYANTIQFTHH